MKKGRAKRRPRRRNTKKIKRYPKPLTKEQFRKMVMMDKGMDPTDYE